MPGPWLKPHHFLQQTHIWVFLLRVLVSLGSKLRKPEFCGSPHLTHTHTPTHMYQTPAPPNRSKERLLFAATARKGHHGSQQRAMRRWRGRGTPPGESVTKTYENSRYACSVLVLHPTCVLHGLRRKLPKKRRNACAQNKLQTLENQRVPLELVVGSGRQKKGRMRTNNLVGCLVLNSDS